LSPIAPFPIVGVHGKQPITRSDPVSDLGLQHNPYGVIDRVSLSPAPGAKIDCRQSHFSRIDRRDLAAAWSDDVFDNGRHRHTGWISQYGSVASLCLNPLY
jgi:hypothetical protein